MSGIKKRSVSLSGHRTSYSIEDEFQTALSEMARNQSVSLAQLIATIDDARGTKSNLSSALRIAVLLYVQTGAATQIDANNKAGSANSDQI